MADERTLHERLIELAVFVPIGIATSVAEELPALAEKGRERLTNQLRVARMVGQLTVAQAQRQMEKRKSEAETAAARPGPGPGEGSTAQGGAPPRSKRVSAAVRRPPAKKSPPDRANVVAGEQPDDAGRTPAGGGEGPAAATLAIPGYDTLAASQVVQRLASLRADELEAVRRYELATRGRRTILHRIAQLSSSDGRA